MESVSWMSDYLPVKMLAMAQAAERRFEECLMSCPRAEGVIRIDDPEVFARLIENRIASLLLSLAALESYLSYFAYETAKKIEDDDPGATLSDYLEKNRLSIFFKDLPNRIKRRHELIIEENGGRPLRRFLTGASLTLEEKIMYWLLIRTGKMINFKEGYTKKLFRIIELREEILHPKYDIAPEVRKVGKVEEMKVVFLHHDLPAGLTPGKSCSNEYVVEHYAEGHFFWELLHCYPARVVAEVIQYLHSLDDSENHFIAAVRLAELVDPSGEAITEPMKKYVIEVNLEE